MLYGGPDYGGSKYCSACESTKWHTVTECHSCGKLGCNLCLELRHFGTEAETNYQDEVFLCITCAELQVMHSPEPFCEECLVDRIGMLEFRAAELATAVCCSGVAA